MPDRLENYQQLEKKFRRLSILGDAASMLHWDSATMMPPGAAPSRSEQVALLATLRHGILVEPETADLLAAAEAEELADMDAWQAANLTEMRRIWIHAAALDAKLVEALSKASSACETKWRTARAEADFAAVRPTLEEVLSLVREVAAAKSDALGCAPYDALLDEYEPAMTCADIDAVFGDLDAFLGDFLGQALEAQAQAPEIIWPEGPFPVAAQRALGITLMERLGFDFDGGRLDTSHHPFSGGTPDDIRITTRFDENDFTSGLMAILHETGHALYEKGLPADWRHQPVGTARGMAVHESQSLLVEMQVCRSAEFLSFAAPLMRDAFGGKGQGTSRAWEIDNLQRLYTRVTPGCIRVDADEVTYPAHVILRYNLERPMIAGDLRIADLPGAWNEAMDKMLGLRPADDSEGCLQDIHWYDGAWGYFPSYTLGALAAAQIFAAAKRDQPAIVAGIADGDFRPLFAWLGENIHRRASSLTTKELMEQATGKALTAEAFKSHLETRYLA